jgi:hypothetical protein
MVPRLTALLILLAACKSGGGEGAGGQGEAEDVVIPAAPAGAAHRTARDVSYADVLHDLAGVDVVFVAAPAEMELSVLGYLHKRGRLHAIGLPGFARTAQPALDDFAFGRIDEAELAARCGAVPEEHRLVLAFARERRLPLLGLGVEEGIARDLAAGGVSALREEERQSLPALPPGRDTVEGLRHEVAADVVVRWYRGAPEGAQVLILAGAPWIAPRDRLPERLFGRSGKTYRTLVAVGGTEATADRAIFARSFADYVWLLGPP